MPLRHTAWALTGQRDRRPEEVDLSSVLVLGWPRRGAVGACGRDAGWCRGSRGADGTRRRLKHTTGRRSSLGVEVKSALDGPAASGRRPARRGAADFDEPTSRWRIEVWTGWTPLFRPAGELVSRPVRPPFESSWPSADAAASSRPRHGQPGRSSSPTPTADDNDRLAAYLARHRRVRLLRPVQATSFCPDADRDSVHVAFPLEAGNVHRRSCGRDVGVVGCAVAPVAGRRVRTATAPIASWWPSGPAVPAAATTRRSYEHASHL